MAILSKGLKPDKFGSQKYLELNFNSVSGLCSNFVECDSFLELKLPDK